MCGATFCGKMATNGGPDAAIFSTKSNYYKETYKCLLSVCMSSVLPGQHILWVCTLPTHANCTAPLPTHLTNCTAPLPTHLTNTRQLYCSLANTSHQNTPIVLLPCQHISQTHANCTAPLPTHLTNTCNIYTFLGILN